MKSINTKLSVGIFGFTAIVGLIVAALVGWVMNIVAIADAPVFTVMVLLRLVGVFMAPIGSVLGYL